MSTEYDGLEPIEPDDALRLYLDHKETEYSKNTVRAHRYRLQYFVQWCEETGLSNSNDLTGRHLQEYRLWRKEDVPVEIVGNRMDVSRKVLKKHYDQRSEEVKLEQRRGYLEDI